MRVPYLSMPKIRLLYSGLAFMNEVLYFSMRCTCCFDEPARRAAGRLFFRHLLFSLPLFLCVGVGERAATAFCILHSILVALCHPNHKPSFKAALGSSKDIL